MIVLSEPIAPTGCHKSVCLIFQKADYVLFSRMSVTRLWQRLFLDCETQDIEISGFVASGGGVLREFAQSVRTPAASFSSRSHGGLFGNRNRTKRACSRD